MVTLIAWENPLSSRLWVFKLWAQNTDDLVCEEEDQMLVGSLTYIKLSDSDSDD